MNKKFYKVLAKGRKSCNGGRLTWKVGVWQPKIADIEPCKRGYHLCRAKDLCPHIQRPVQEQAD